MIAKLNNYQSIDIPFFCERPFLCNYINKSTCI